MRITAITALLILLGWQATGKQNDTAHFKRPPGKNEMGIFIDPFVYEHANGYSVPLGIQYKRWATEHLGYRIIVGFGDYFNDGDRQLLEVKNDTAFSSQTSTSMTMAFLGGGLDMQHKFIGKSYLYAAVEARFGYGSGYTHNTIAKETAYSSQDTNFYYAEYTPNFSYDVTKFVVNISPYIGCKLNLKRLVLGTEISAIVTGITHSAISPGFSNTNFDFDIGRFQQRFYISYRF